MQSCSQWLLIEFSCLYWSFMEYLLLSLLIVIVIVSYLNHRRDRKLLCSVSSPTRGTRAERKLSIKMWRRGTSESHLSWLVCEEKEWGAQRGESGRCGESCEKRTKPELRLSATGWMPYHKRAIHKELLNLLPHKWKLQHPERALTKQEEKSSSQCWLQHIGSTKQ